MSPEGLGLPTRFTVMGLAAGVALAGCMQSSAGHAQAVARTAAQAVGDTPTRARSSNGMFVSWREHIVDDTTSSGEPLTGGDGLVLGDLDRDGREDIVSVHESDTRYDGTPDGFVRIAFATDDPLSWLNVTLAQGGEAAAPEDAAIADVNGDGYLDVIVASELAHLIYFQNPGASARTTSWARVILPQTLNRGSFIRVFLADLDGDGRPEVATANKGAQNPSQETTKPTAVSIFSVKGDPLDGRNWVERELGRFPIPQNAQPIDIDGDGDLDIVAGVRKGAWLVLFENTDQQRLAFVEREIEIDGARAGGFNLDFADVNGDGRLDIFAATGQGLGWLEQPPSLAGVWAFHRIGDFGPDSLTGMALSDIDGDGDQDVIVGSYSSGPRDQDGAAALSSPMGRLGWFANPGAASDDWVRHDISRRRRGMFDKFVARDLDGDGDTDFLGTRGNSNPHDGVFWLEQVRTREPRPAFERARPIDSQEMTLPPETRP